MIRYEVYMTALLTLGAIFMTWGISTEYYAQSSANTIFLERILITVFTNSTDFELYDRIAENYKEIEDLGTITKFLGLGMIIFSFYFGYLATKK